MRMGEGAFNKFVELELLQQLRYAVRVHRVAHLPIRIGVTPFEHPFPGVIWHLSEFFRYFLLHRQDGEQK